MTILLDAQGPDAAQVSDILNRGVIEFALTAELQFVSEPMYMTNRLIPFTANGVQWRAYGDFVSVDSAEGGPDNPSAVMTYTMGIPSELQPENVDMERVYSIISDRSDYYNQPAILGIQLFDDGGPVGVPIVLNVSLMRTLELSFGRGGLIRFKMTAESVFAGDRRSPGGLLTDRDQQARHPGDEFFEYRPTSATEPVDWLSS